MPYRQCSLGRPAGNGDDVAESGKPSGAGGKPRCRNLPLVAASPPQISRSDLAPPTWQNRMATNRACVYRRLRQSRCGKQAVTSAEKMLHTLFKAESSSECLSLGKFAPSDRRLSLIFTGSGQQR